MAGFYFICQFIWFDCLQRDSVCRLCKSWPDGDEIRRLLFFSDVDYPSYSLPQFIQRRVKVFAAIYYGDDYRVWICNDRSQFKNLF